MSKISFNAFLSHRYKSPEVNLYFFKLFNRIAEVQFDVDKAGGDLNVTRLERMVRNADAFVGIYPFHGTWEESHNPEEIGKKSKYFRLEIDLAIRSQKPAIIFYDERFSDVISPPDGIFSYTFNINEITGSGLFPSKEKHLKIFREFCDSVKNRKTYDNSLIFKKNTLISFVIPNGNKENEPYSADFINVISTILKKKNFSNLRKLEWPPSLNKDTFKTLEEIDFAIVDVGFDAIATGLPAFLHGRFIPMLRLRHLRDVSEANTYRGFDNCLYGSVDCYSKDIVAWDKMELFEAEFSKRIDRIVSRVERIKTHQDATQYFLGAALRKDAVFLSYAGKDIEIASKISMELKQKFQTVFDYRDGVSIESGKLWIEEIKNNIHKSKIAILLMSESYVASKPCMQEATQIITRFFSGNIILKPLKLEQKEFELPPLFEGIQYKRKWEYANIKEMLASVIKELPKVDK
jgi:hypothetical protein